MKKLAFLLVVFALAVPLASAFAQSATQATPTSSASPAASGNCASTDGFVSLSCVPGFVQAEQSNSLAAFFQTVYNLCIGAAAIIAVIQISRAGVMYMTSGGNTSSTSEAKRLIWTALMGLVLVLSPVLIFSFINPNINNFSLLTNDAKSLTIKPSSSTTLPPGTGGTSSGSGNTTADSSNSANPAAGSNAPSTSSAANPPTNVQATNASATSVNLSWTAPSGGTQPSSYQISDNGQLVATASGGNTAATISGLATGSSHSYTVSSVDAQGNVSPPAPPVTIVVQAAEISSSTDGSQGSVAYWEWADTNNAETANNQNQPLCWIYSVQPFPVPYQNNNEQQMLAKCQKAIQDAMTNCTDKQCVLASSCTFLQPGQQLAQTPAPGSPVCQ